MTDDLDRPDDAEANRPETTDAGGGDRREANDDVPPAAREDARVTTDPDRVREWAEARDVVPAMAPDVSGPEAYALRRENVVDGGAHERVGWGDFLAALRGDDVAFRHSTRPAEGETEAVAYHDFVAGETAERGVDAADVATQGDEAERGADATPADVTTAERGHAPDAAVDETASDPDAARDPTAADEASDRVATLGSDAEGDSVVDAGGETVGIVTAVAGDTVYVDPDPGLTEKLSAKLGWADADDAGYTVDVDDVAAVEGGEVHLHPLTL